MAKTNKDKVTALLKKAYETEKAYEGAYTKAVEEYEAVERELNAQKVELEQFHKMYILEQITHDTYLAEKAKIDKLDEKLRDVGSRVNEINRYKMEDIREVYTEIEAIVPEFAKEVGAEQN